MGHVSAVTCPATGMVLCDRGNSGLMNNEKREVVFYSLVTAGQALPSVLGYMASVCAP